MPVRDATDTDLPEIVRVVNLAYRVEEFFIGGDRMDLAHAKERAAVPGAIFLVIDSRVPGRLAAAVCFEGRGDHAYFGLLAVDPAHQGEGHARALMTAMEARCRALGYRRLVLDIVNLRSELPAFYRRFGFAETGETCALHRDTLLQPAHLVIYDKPVPPVGGEGADLR